VLRHDVGAHNGGFGRTTWGKWARKAAPPDNFWTKGGSARGLRGGQCCQQQYDIDWPGFEPDHYQEGTGPLPVRRVVNQEGEDPKKERIQQVRARKIPMNKGENCFSDLVGSGRGGVAQIRQRKLGDPSGSGGVLQGNADQGSLGRSPAKLWLGRGTRVQRTAGVHPRVG